MLPSEGIPNELFFGNPQLLGCDSVSPWGYCNRTSGALTSAQAHIEDQDLAYVIDLNSCRTLQDKRLARPVSQPSPPARQNPITPPRKHKTKNRAFHRTSGSELCRTKEGLGKKRSTEELDGLSLWVASSTRKISKKSISPPPNSADLYTLHPVDDRDDTRSEGALARGAARKI